jgi:GNAT superfamily N-acetyltransferase
MNDRTVVIREVTEYLPEVEEAVKKLVSQLSDHAQPLSEQDLKMMIDSDSTYLYLAYHKDSNEVVGMVTLIRYRIPYKMKGWIEDVVVDEAHRRQGIGESLLQHAISEARRLGVRSLNLTSNPMRGAANQLYQRLGFEQRETNVYRLNLE